MINTRGGLRRGVPEQLADGVDVPGRRGHDDHADHAGLLCGSYRPEQQRLTSQVDEGLG